MRDHGTCSACGAETDPDDYCCAECADAHDEAVRAEERESIAAMVRATFTGVVAVDAVCAAIRARGTKEEER